MVTPTTGAVILIPFPFSDLSQSKLRPAVVLASAGNNDWVLCQVTSKSYADQQAVKLNDTDFSNGSLQVVSYARPAKLFTASRNLIVVKIGELRQETTRQVIDAVIKILKTGV